MVSQIIIKKSTIADILERIKRNPHIELVYLGIGTKTDNRYHIDYFVECSNISGNPSIEFVADPLCIYNAYVEAEKKRYDIITILHSHPGLPSPSSKDLQGMRQWPIPWIIVDSRSLAFRAWILVDDKISSMDIALVD